MAQIYEGGESEHAPSAETLANQLIEETNKKIDEISPSSSSFSQKGFDSLREKIADYIGELIVEAAKEARRHQVDIVSKVHVERASEYLVSSKAKRRSQIQNTFGGLLGGGGISGIVSLALAGHLPLIATLILFLLTVFGAVMLALSFKD